MNVFDLFPSPYLSAGDFDSREFTLTITAVEVEKLADGTRKPAVWFREAEKPLLLNKTNAVTIANRYSPETEAWEGRPLTLYPTTTDFRGQVVDCIRVKVPEALQTAAETPAERPAEHLTRAIDNASALNRSPFRKTAGNGAVVANAAGRSEQ